MRRARAADAAALAAIGAKRPTSAGWTRAQLAEECSRAGSVVLAAEDGGRLAGYALARELAPELQVLDVAVDPAFERRGHGRRLVEALIEAARERGLTKLTLEVEAGNEPAVGLYRRLGFAEVGRRKDFYGKGRHALLMDLVPPKRG